MQGPPQGPARLGTIEVNWRSRPRGRRGEHRPMALRAYIVEDSPTIRENLVETLEELGEVYSRCQGLHDRLRVIAADEQRSHHHVSTG